MGHPGKPPGLDPFLRNSGRSGRQAEFHRAYGPGMTWEVFTEPASESGCCWCVKDCKGICLMRYNGLHDDHYQYIIQYVQGN